MTNCLRRISFFASIDSVFPLQILAPGQQLESALPGNKTGVMSGTSFSSPIVAGILGIWAALNSTWDTKFALGQLQTAAVANTIEIPQSIFNPTDNLLAQLGTS
jgi:subtilase family serine protease